MLAPTRFASVGPPCCGVVSRPPHLGAGLWIFPVPGGLPSRVRGGMLAPMKGIPDDLRAVLDRIRDGGYRDDDLAALRIALGDGRLVAAIGDRAVAAGGDIDGAVIVTGDKNNVVVLDLSPDRDGALLDRLFPPGLFQLAPDLADFVGRESQIEKVLETMRSGGEAAISAFAGLGGVGKTALAVHVAHRLKDDYPHGQIVVQMRGTDDEPLEPADAMARVIHAFEPEARLPDDLDELSPIYHHVLDGRRVLVLLDNARDAAQVRPLRVKGPSGLIITSRGTIALEGLQGINLEKMSLGEANELLKETAGSGRTNGAQRKMIGQLCGRLPLALRVAGTFLSVYRGWSVDEYIEELTDERTRLGRLKQDDLDVEAVLGLSARQLVREDAELAGRWQMLSVMVSDFDRPAAAAVCDMSDAEARDDLERLAEGSLLEYARKATRKQAARYRFHDLMRPVARRAFSYADACDSEADQERLAEAEARHAAHYRGVLAHAQRLYLEGNEAIQRGLALYETEFRNIHAGQAWAVRHAPDDDRAAALCDEYANAGVYILNLRLHPREWIAWFQAALAAAQRLGRRQAEGSHLGNLGNAHAALDERRRAIEFFEQHLDLAREIGDRAGEGNALGNLGDAYRALGEVRRAIEFFERQLVIVREIGDRRGEGNALGGLGIAYAVLGEVRRAIQFFERQLVIVREIGDRHGEGSALGNLGNAYRALGEPRRAIEFHEQTLVIAREIGDRRAEGSALGSLGNAYAALGEPRRGIEFHEQALVIHREIGNRSGQGSALGNLGLAYGAVGELRRAIEFHEQQLEITRKIGNRSGEGAALGNLGIAHGALGEPRRAIEFCEQHLEIAREIGDRCGEGTALGNLGNAYAALGEPRRAIEFHEQALAIAGEIGDRPGEGAALCNMGPAFNRLGERNEAIQRGEAALEILEAIEDPFAEEVRKRLAEWREERGDG